jgi:hypothetical protein
MKYLAIIISLLNLYIGLRFFLNVIRLLQTSKYSRRSTTLFALLFLLLTAGGIYYTFYDVNYPIAIVVGAGPWAIGLFVLIINFISEDYK